MQRFLQRCCRIICNLPKFCLFSLRVQQNPNHARSISSTSSACCLSLSLSFAVAQIFGHSISKVWDQFSARSKASPPPFIPLKFGLISIGHDILMPELPPSHEAGNFVVVSRFFLGGGLLPGETPATWVQCSPAPPAVVDIGIMVLSDP